MRRSLCVLAICLAFVVPSRAADDQDQELKNLAGTEAPPADGKAMAEHLQGKWERTDTDQEGNAFRIEKHFDGPNETFAVYHNGEQVYAHVAKDYRIEVLNPDEHLYAYSVDGFEITVGQRKGEKIDQLIEYLFRVKDGRFIEVSGVLDNDPRQPSLTVYERVQEKTE